MGEGQYLFVSKIAVVWSEVFVRFVLFFVFVISKLRGFRY